MQIDEIFYSLQGEGTRRGQPCTFVRLTGCHLRCKWCDTTHSFTGGTAMTIDQILHEVKRHPAQLICVTGGEPLLQESVHELMQRLLTDGYTVLLETSGAIDAESVDPAVIRILDLKAPASGECDRNEWRNVDNLRPTDEVKIVVDGRADYDWAKDQVHRHALVGRCARVLLSPAHPSQDPTELADWILRDGLPVTLQLQEHKLLWPGVTRGV